MILNLKKQFSKRNVPVSSNKSPTFCACAEAGKLAMGVVPQRITGRTKSSVLCLSDPSGLVPE